MSRAALNINSRIVREYSPQTWEASGFSQNGEDGIIDFLLNKLIKKNSDSGAWAGMYS